MNIYADTGGEWEHSEMLFLTLMGSVESSHVVYNARGGSTTQGGHFKCPLKASARSRFRYLTSSSQDMQLSHLCPS